MDRFVAPYDAIAEWYDAYLDGPLYEELILPSLLDLAGDVRDQRVLDLACGQGWIARELSKRKAIVTGIDISLKLLAVAQRYESAEPLGVTYIHDDAQSLRRLDGTQFDGVICNMALMDIPDAPATFCAARRVLRDNGWLIFSITHPCFEVPGAAWVTREDDTVTREVAGYFTECFWRSDNPQGVRGKVGAHHRTLATYLNALAAAGFCLEQAQEPRATGRRARQVPGNEEVPSMMLIRAKAEG